MAVNDAPPPPAPDDCTRDELVAMIARAHHLSAYAESTLAGKTLAARSKLPKAIAENLGAGFGQWEFFPEPEEIVEFACSYVPPATEDDVWAMARAWASDDAAARHTVLALVGRELIQHELRRIDVPALRELFGDIPASRAFVLRESLGLAVPAKAPATSAPKAPPKRRAPRAAAPENASAAEGVPAKMPKPRFVRPPARVAAPPAKRFHHPKFGEGTLESQDGVGPEAKLTIKFETGTKTLLARYVTEAAS